MIISLKNNTYLPYWYPFLLYVFSIHEFSIRGCVCFLYGVGDMRVFMWCREYVFFIERGIGKMCFYKSIFKQKNCSLGVDVQYIFEFSVEFLHYYHTSLSLEKVE